MATRPAWEGHLKLSLVTCPVALYPATARGKAVRFNMINPETGTRIRTRVQDASTGQEIDRAETVKGFEVDKGLYVRITDEEIKARKLPDTGSLEIHRFVPLKDIDRLYWASPYYLVPDGDVAVEPFSVIREATRAEGKVALATYVKGGKERQLALEPRGTGIIAHELRPHDEVHAAGDFFDRIPDRKPDKGMVAIARQILAQHEGPFEPTEFRDRYREGLLALIEEKKAAQGARPAPSGYGTRDEGVVITSWTRSGEVLRGARVTSPRCFQASPPGQRAKAGAGGQEGFGSHKGSSLTGNSKTPADWRNGGGRDDRRRGNCKHGRASQTPRGHGCSGSASRAIR